MKETYVTYKLWQGCSAPRNLEKGSRLIGERVSTDVVDRDALRKVADEINVDAEHISGYLDSCEGNFSENEANEYYKLTGWADRIRKALGVEK